MGGADVLLAEQRYVAGLYRRLDELRAETAQSLRAVRLSRAGGTPQSRSERDVFAALHEQRLAQLLAVEDGLCFGRLDRVPSAEDASAGEPVHIGRVGLAGEGSQTLLVDWRAPVAEPFYRATAAEPLGVARRRHLRTRGRDVTGYDDEVLALDALSEDDRRGLSGEAALLAALQEHRTGRMRDAVATLQAEQDRVVRAPREGVLVVQGGPGTGKTVVALHRAAYLLYTYRERLAASGVLVVGPGEVFLRYVSSVLPSLGETSVVLAALGELFPGVTARGSEPDDVAMLKGDRRMVDVLRAAVADRQRLPARDVELDAEGRRLRLRRSVVERARERARRGGRPHNDARNAFLRDVLSDLGRQLVGRDDWATRERSERDEVLRDLIRTPAVRAAVSRAWPHLTPQDFLRDLFADRGRVELAGSELTPSERSLLLRARDAEWTPADVPLLDEAAELLGESDPWVRRRAVEADREQRRERRYAEQVLAGSGAGDGMVAAGLLAQRYAGTQERSDLADHAGQDRSWVFGHVVVDEAQELTSMAWRLLVRRCPSRSMTVVGDIAQGGSPWAVRAWSQALEEHAPGRWQVAELTIGYRTPEQVMRVAADVLAAIDPALRTPRAVRAGSVAPRAVASSPDGLLADAVACVRAERDAVGEGRVGVLAPRPLLPALRTALATALPGEVGTGTESAVAVLAVREAKGLEFDAVVVVDPAAILAGSERGLGDLYVAMTRTTDRLVVLHPDALPPVLARLRGS